MGRGGGRGCRGRTQAWSRSPDSKGVRASLPACPTGSRPELGWEEEQGTVGPAPAPRLRSGEESVHIALDRMLPQQMGAPGQTCPGRGLHSGGRGPAWWGLRVQGVGVQVAGGQALPQAVLRRRI